MLLLELLSVLSLMLYGHRVAWQGITVDCRILGISETIHRKTRHCLVDSGESGIKRYQNMKSRSRCLMWEVLRAMAKII